jgi:hypothetical protein
MSQPKLTLVSVSRQIDDLELATVRAAAMGDTANYERGMAELKRLKALRPALLEVATTTPPASTSDIPSDRSRGGN